jgi:hypothetical protein
LEQRQNGAYESLIRRFVIGDFQSVNVPPNKFTASRVATCPAMASKRRRKLYAATRPANAHLTRFSVSGTIDRGDWLDQLALPAGIHGSGRSKKVCQHPSTGVLEWHDNEGSPLVFHHARLKPPAFTTDAACFYTH